MSITDQCVEAYQRHKHLRLAGQEVGIPWQTVYVHLRKAGIPVVGDKVRYGSESDRFAAKSEMDLLRYIPFAIDHNRHQFQPLIDFTIRGYGVDLKASRLAQSNPKSTSMRWNFSLKKQEVKADFFICLGYDEEGKVIRQCLLVPGEIARHYTSVSLSERGGK